MTTGKTIALTLQTFVSKVISLPFNTLSRFVIAFPHYFMASVPVHSDFGVWENTICHCFHFSPFYLPWSNGVRWPDLSFLNAEFQASFFTLFFHCHHHFLPLEWYYLHIRGCWYMLWHFQFQLVIHPAWHFIWGTLHMLNKQGDNIHSFFFFLNIHSCHTPFPVSVSHFFHVQF